MAAAPAEMPMPMPTPAPIPGPESSFGSQVPVTVVTTAALAEVVDPEVAVAADPETEVMEHEPSARHVRTSRSSSTIATFPESNQPSASAIPN